MAASISLPLPISESAEFQSQLRAAHKLTFWFGQDGIRQSQDLKHMDEADRLQLVRDLEAQARKRLEDLSVALHGKPVPMDGLRSDLVLVPRDWI